MADAKEMWKAIKSRFGGNDESKKMHKYLLKQQFERFFVSTSEGLHKRYDRFHTLLSQLEIHGAGVSHEDAKQKFLRSLPSSWSQVALIMRTKLGLDTLSFDDLYNNLSVFERDVKGTTTSSSSNTQNVAFVPADNMSSTNDVSTAYSVSSPFISKSHKEGSLSYTDEVIHYFFANQSSAPQLDCDDLEQINDGDLEEMNLKWQTKVECFSCHKMGHFARDYRAKKNQDRRRRDVGYNGNKARDNGRKPAYHDDSKALVTIDGEDIDWSGHFEEYTQNYAMMAYFSSNSGLTMRYGSILSYENEVLQSVFMNKESDLENTSVNDRYAKGMHALPPPMTRNYMPFGPNVEIDYFKFTYGPKQTLGDESDSKPSEYASSDSDSSVEMATSMPAPVDNAPKIVCEPKVENVRETGTPNHCPKIEKHDRHSHAKKGLGYAFTRKACFVCGSFSHLIRDCDFHEKRMAKHAALTKSKDKDDPHKTLKDKGIINSGCTRYMTWNKAHLADYQEFKGGSVAFVGSNGRITGIKREYSNARTPQQNGFAERKNMTLIEAARTMLSDSFLPTTFWAEAVNTACYVLNRVLVTKPQNKTPYEILTSRQPIISYLRPFRCHVTILNTIDQLGKFDEKSDSGFLVGYSLNNKAFRVYNLETKRVEENMHVNFLENKPNVVGKGHAWMFDLDYLTNSMNYEPIILENQANKSAGPKEANYSVGTEANDDQGENSEEIDLHDEHFVLPILSTYSTTVKSSRDKIQKTVDYKTFNVVSTPISTAGPSIALNDDEPSYLNDPLMPHLKDIYVSPSEGIFTDSSYDDEGVKVWILLDLPFGKKAIGTKWVYRNKKDERGVVVRNKARLVAQGHIQEEGSSFLYGTIDEEVYVTQPLGFVDPKLISVKTAGTLIDTQKPLVKDEEAADVDIHLYRSMVTPKTSHLQAVKRIFRKSTTVGCQFLGRRLISWQCKKQTIVATSTTEAEYVAAAHCCGQVL
nr:retrovirus-related Pol polyprotein from transposon TNT 1-94 [Tanacetum cinerariifolium]